MSNIYKLSSSHIYSIFKLIKIIKKSNRIFIASGSHVSEILEFHMRTHETDVFLTFNIDRFVAKFYKNKFFKYALLKFLNVDCNDKALILFNTGDRCVIDMLHSIFKNCHIYIKYVDIISDIFKDKNKFFKCLDGVVSTDSYSRKDALNYNLLYIPNLVNKNKLLEFVKNSKEKTDTFLFLGLYSEARFKSLVALLDKFKNTSVKFNFMLLIDEEKIDDIKYRVNNVNSLYKYKAFTLFTQKISYKEYLSLFAKSAGIIDFYRLESDEGYSYRVFECIATNKKLITNRNLTDESFYNKELIYNIDTDSLDDFSTFINSKAQYNSTYIDSLQNYLKSSYIPKNS